MTRHIEKQQPGRVTVSDATGIRIFDEGGKEIASVDGNSAFYIRLARECMNVAFTKQSQEQR